MCGRYSLTHTAEEIASRFDVTAPAEYAPRYNVAPTQVMPVVRADGDRRQLARLRWGLVPFWAKDRTIGNRMINARSETASEKPAFRAAFRRRRCLVPADSFYEWVEHEGKKWPIRISFDGGELGAFAGLWERWSSPDGEVVESYTILTTDADPVLSELHDRMPLWAPEQFWQQWLFEDDDAEEVLELMREDFPAESVGYEPVSRELNRPQNDSAKLVRPLDDPELPRR